jgi:hypothetical protein
VKTALLAPLIGLALIAMAPGGAHGDSWQVTAPLLSDSWNSTDDEDQPTWRELVGAQAPALVLFLAFVALAQAGFVHKTTRLKTPLSRHQFSTSVIFRSQMFSVTNGLTGGCQTGRSSGCVQKWIRK